MIARLCLVLSLFLLAPASGAQDDARPAQAPSPAPEAPEATPEPRVSVFTASVVKAYPHDPAAFTQGLLWHDGWLYESTGRIGTSTIRKVDLETGEVAAVRAIPSGQFGEGLALWDEELISLTWRDGAIHRWSLSDLSRLRTYSDYLYEGWGLARLGDHLVTSDGSSSLRFLNPETYAVERSVTVTLNGRALNNLNELEVIDGLVFANIWQTDYIVGIDPVSGAVRTLIDCRSLPKPPGRDRDAVLNGIAWDEEGRRLFVTGKLWSNLYQIELTPSGVLK